MLAPIRAHNKSELIIRRFRGVTVMRRVDNADLKVSAPTRPDGTYSPGTASPCTTVTCFGAGASQWRTHRRARWPSAGAASIDYYLFLSNIYL